MVAQLLTERESRQQVSDGMLETYGEEVPLFKTLHEKVRSRNDQFVENAQDNAEMQQKLAGANLEQLGNIRHAAIRLALQDEMEMFVRVMNQLVQFPVAYYDLTASGTPVKSTVLRPVHDEEIQENAFTIFSSMLDFEALDFSSDPELRSVIEDVLEERRIEHFKGEGIFSQKLIELVEKAEIEGLSEEERQEYVKEVVDIFQLNKESLIDKDTYERIKDISPVASDILGAGLNINHLTPDTPDISGVYEDMKAENIVMNGFIYGPKGIDILLEQTSFKAVTVELTTPEGEKIEHQARFGEVESRGMAISVSGREIYDEVLKEINSQIKEEREAFKEQLKKEGKEYSGEIRDNKESELGEKYIKIGMEKFPEAFPNTEKDLALQGLAYFKYEINEEALAQADSQEIKDILDQVQKTQLKLSENESDQQKIITEELNPLMEALVEAGVAERNRIKYRDFLPASAAGIFSSNRDKDGAVKEAQDMAIAQWYKEEIGVTNFYDLYEHTQAKAMMETLSKLEEKGIKVDGIDTGKAALQEAFEKGDPDKIVQNHRDNVIPKLREKFKEAQKEILGEPNQEVGKDKGIDDSPDVDQRVGK